MDAAGLPLATILQIHQIWQWYILSGPGDPRHAASFELLVAVARLLDITRPRTLIDTGSGVTSILMAMWAREHGAAAWHYDDSEEWLDKTAGCFQRFALPTHGLVMWEPNGRSPGAHVDFLLHDLGTPETRVATMPIVADRARTLVVDDLHFDAVRQAALSTGRTFKELAHTRDGYGRYAGVSLPRLVMP